jgi:hypothetical protein
MLSIHNENLIKVIYNNFYQNELSRYLKQLRNRFLLKSTIYPCKKEIDYITFTEDTLAIWYKNTNYNEYNKEY